jgi:glycosyltransferase involved in cell wall biosynthesis
VKFNIILISSGQPSLNPRLVKEADALATAGYGVTVLYTYWNEWGTRYDKQLLAEKKWIAIRIGGDPHEKPLTYFISRLIHKTSKFILQKTSFYSWFANLAVARASYFLIKEAKKHKADLYIGHNLGALPATARTAKLHKKPYGFDAEDFHRQEITDDVNSYHFQIVKYLEDKYLPQTSYLTASSPLIAEYYASLYNREVSFILNVFPKTGTAPAIDTKNAPLKLFWFSQTIGANRGLEKIIEAIALTSADIELHLLGKPADGYKQQLLQLAQKVGANSNQIHFHEPIRADEIFTMASQFDIGLASETGFCLNNNIALSNKIFTYIQIGLAIAVSNTPAQSEFINQYYKAGRIYNTANELSLILNEFNDHRELLYQAKNESYQIGQIRLNWETESRTFLEIIKKTLKR